MTNLRYSVKDDNFVEGRWVVMMTDPPEYGGNLYVASFDGPNAEARAIEYATWKNVFVGGSKGGLNGGMFRR